MMATRLWKTPHPWKSAHHTDSHRCLEKPSALPPFPQAGRRTKLSTQSGNFSCRSEGILIDAGQPIERRAVDTKLLRHLTC